MDAEALIDRLADTTAELEVDSLRNTLAMVKEEVIVDALADRLTDVEVNVSGNALAKVDSKTVAFGIALKKLTGQWQR